MNHISGFMPWWRGKVWGANHMWINHQLMYSPESVKKVFDQFNTQGKSKLILSLVPTQLKRLLDKKVTIKLLQQFDIIWIGGAGLSNELANTARQAEIRLCPCYGATETTAMISVLSPDAFLAGENSCGHPLQDIEAYVGDNGVLKIKTSRLATQAWKNNELKTITDKNGWWESGDLAKLITTEKGIHLNIIGRVDTAINSGGEIIYPENLSDRLREIANQEKLPIENIILLPIEDYEWGEVIAAIIKIDRKFKGSHQTILCRLKALVAKWPKHEQPKYWEIYQSLSTNKLGKVNRKELTKIVQELIKKKK